MRLTLVVLLAWLTIHGMVLSLPPSLIANAASLRPQQLLQPPPPSTSMLMMLPQQREPDYAEDAEDAAASVAAMNALWKKDTRYLIDTNAGAERAADGFDSAARRIQSIQGNSNANNHNGNNNNNNYKVTSATTAKAAHQRVAGGGGVSGVGSGGSGGSGLDLNRKLAAEYDLNALLADNAATAAAAATTSSAAAAAAADDEMDAAQSMELLYPPPQEIAPRLRDASTEFFKPLKYWARQRCEQSNDCPQKYYRALLADRNKAAALKQMQDFATVPLNEEPSYLVDNADNIEKAADDDVELFEDGDGDYVNNDIFMLLTGEQDLMTFLHWAMQQLYPHQKFPNASIVGNSAEYYYPGMFIWKKLNLSGQLEPPMVVDEPHYMIVRREQDEPQTPGSNYNDDPFIPPRGRKHHLPDLDALLQRYETFVPNRGKRDRIKDIFKYDDLFFPNRGKKHRAPPNRMQPAGRTASETKLENERKTTAATYDENATMLSDKLMAPPSLPPPPTTTTATTITTAAAIRRMFEKLKRKLLQQQQRQQRQRQQQQQKGYWQQKVAGNKNKQTYEFDANNELPQRMSTHKINGYDRSVKSSMPAAAAATITREMSAPAPAATTTATENAMQQQQLWQTRFIGARPRRLGAFGAASAARVAANRLHSTRSMSAVQQLQRHQQQKQQQRRPSTSTSTSLSSSPSLSSSSSLSSAPASRYRRREQQQQHATKAQLPSLSSLSAATATSDEQQPPQHQVKSLTNLDPLLWRQLQLLQQKALTMQHAQLPWQQQQQQHQPPQETQLDVANAADADADAAADFSDDTDYFYFNI